MAPGELRQVSSICTECGAPVAFECGAMQVRCEYCGAGLAVEQGQRLVHLACPACGGDFYYLDGSMSGHCPHCRTPLLALSHDCVLRYVFPPAAPAPADAPDAQLLLLPFWHLSGLLYVWDVGKSTSVQQDPSGPDHVGDAEAAVPTFTRRDSGPIKTFRGALIDMSTPDAATSALGVASLRLRAAVLPMEPFSAEHERLARVLPPLLSIPDATERLLERAMRFGKLTELTALRCQRADLVAQQLALYYYPFWMRGEPGVSAAAWDGVTGRPEQLVTPTRLAEEQPCSVAFDELRVIELNCGDCGQPLRAGNHAAVLPCACGRFWAPSREGLRRVTACYATPHLAGQQLLWLPFWRVPTTVWFRGQQATTVGDVVGRLGLLRPALTVPGESPTEPLHFYVPAYGAMTAPRVDHAARDMTRLQPRLAAGPAAEGELYHCFFEPADARRLAYATWIQTLPSSVPRHVRSLRVETGEPKLWYVPFEDCGRELHNLVTDLRYDRMAFRGLCH